MSEYWYLWVIGIVVLGVAFIKYSQKSVLPEPPQRKLLEPMKKNLTLEQLKEYGPENERVLLALRGIIYDVSNSDFYSRNGAYSMFSGHDASINLAKMSHDKEVLNKYWSYKLDRDEESVLNDWVSRFEMKYPVVGEVIR
jgi:predicted heme/steroid binding protein